jgi:predicted RNA-binding protein with PUA-like domain
MKYWLIKSEEECYSIDDLARDKKTSWDGVRNYQARNFMKDMSVGDKILFYHSSGTRNGVYGLATVAGATHSDISQFDPKNKYFERRATKEKPVWYSAEVGFVTKFKNPIPLSIIKLDPALSGMLLRARGSRLSVQPVTEKHFQHIEDMGRK